MKLADDLWLVSLDPRQFEHALVNLVANARDAMESGGRLTIETRNADPDKVFAAQTAGASVVPSVVVTVKDTGHGMDPETLARPSSRSSRRNRRARGPVSASARCMDSSNNRAVIWRFGRSRREARRSNSGFRGAKRQRRRPFLQRLHGLRRKPGMGRLSSSSKTRTGFGLR